MSKSILYAVNSNSQNIGVNGQISFGSVVRRYGCNCTIVGGSVALEGVGYYDINTNITLLAEGAGIASIQLYKDGVAIPGAIASLSVASGETYSVSIPCIVRNMCCKASVITANLLTLSATISNASIDVRKD